MRTPPPLSLLLPLAFLAANLFAAPPTPPEWRLVWSDNFTAQPDGKPNPAKWNHVTGDGGETGWGNHEAEYYTGPAAANARIENGRLIIEARKEKTPSPARAYTSARLTTKGKGDWKYGRVEVRAKLPRGRGTWPAIWMLPSTTPLRWPDDGEIDIMEHVGHDPGQIHASIHCKNFNHVIGKQKTAATTLADCSDAFHTYSMEWDAGGIAISVDGREYFRYKNPRDARDARASWPFDQPFYLLLNVAVGGAWGGQKGIDDAIWPQRMEIAWVRVYQKQS